MKIEDFGTLQMVRTNEQHFGNGRIVPMNRTITLGEKVPAVDKINSTTHGNSLQQASKSGEKKSFQDFILEAMNTVNTQQTDVTKLQERLITDPDSVDVHDVTIAMSKARMSLNLAHSVIDRLVSSWNEITTTR